MRCFICSAEMVFYFTKRFNAYGLEDVDYWRCTRCGFAASKTHADMTERAWEELNLRFHQDHNARTDNPYRRNQRYLKQGLLLHLLAGAGILPEKDWLDWGSGTGQLSAQLQKWFARTLLNHDAYIQPHLHALSSQDLRKGAYSLVVNTGVFEHVRRRETLDEIASYAAPDGHLAIHTRVRAQIPNDPNWVYFLPVHCAFHTNRSMEILMDQWRFTCSVYCEDALMWVMFRQPVDAVREKVAALNADLGFAYLRFQAGFAEQSQ